MNEETLEYLRRQVAQTSGRSQEQRERWYIIKQQHEIKEMLTALQRQKEN